MLNRLSDARYARFLVTGRSKELSGFDQELEFRCGSHSLRYPPSIRFVLPANNNASWGAVIVIAVDTSPLSADALGSADALAIR